MNVREREIVQQALCIMSRNLKRGRLLLSPDDTRELLQVRLGGCKDEVFGCIFLTNRHAILAAEHLFYGTIDGSSVHPRVVVRRALELNAAAVIFFHNHPSGVAEPSQSDQQITQRLKDSLALVDVKVLDHFVVTVDESTSLAERGMC